MDEKRSGTDNVPESSSASTDGLAEGCGAFSNPWSQTAPLAGSLEDSPAGQHENDVMIALTLGLVLSS